MRLTEDVFVNGNRAICKSYAKINLTLDVVAKREDGYHDVEMIMQTLNLYDIIIVDKMQDGIAVSSNRKYIPTDENNIAHKAAKMFFDKAGISGGASIRLHKNIPVSAGLAGGSGNGGAVLCALNALYEYPLSYVELLDLGAKLGADVAFCIEGGTQLCRGIGEIMTPVLGMKPIAVLLVKPHISVSTPLIYKKLDEHEIVKRPDTNGMINAIENGNIHKISSYLYNVMEPVTEAMHPQIKGIKEKMISDGAVGAIMSGSGPTVFGLFEDEKKAKKSADSFYKQFSEVYITRTFN